MTPQEFQQFIDLFEHKQSRTQIADWVSNKRKEWINKGIGAGWDCKEEFDNRMAQLLGYVKTKDKVELKEMITKYDNKVDLEQAILSWLENRMRLL